MNDVSYLQIKGFLKHQKINRPTASKIPLPPPELTESGNKNNGERRLAEGELKRLADKLLTKWTKHVNHGLTVPPIRRQLAAPHHPAGPTPAQVLHEEYKRRKAAGLIN